MTRTPTAWHRAIIPAVAGFAIAVVASRLSRTSRPMGRTARTGPRTGAIEVDPAVVENRIQVILSKFMPCGEGQGYVRPQDDGAAPPVTVKDVATGELRKVRILLRPVPKPRGNVGGGYLATRKTEIKSGHVTENIIHQDIVLTLGSNTCASPQTWGYVIDDILTHELAHAADHSIILEARGKRKHRPTEVGTAAYYNSPAEMAAQLSEVEKQLRQSGLETYTLYPPLQMLRRGSEKFPKLEKHLTVANRRRFLKLAARLTDEYENP